MIGQPFGPFQVVEKLGEGGMGEVYRARDSRLNRDVALKVLPAHVTGDPERLARFTREAQVLAAFSHPNIGGIYGIEDAGGRQALVLELVEGPTLADRIAQGALPLDEALGVGRQIAEALEAAHEQGIVHRDLKPANIKLRLDGTVKVLDFGLAKAAARPDSASRLANIDVTASPTMMSPATMTSAGVILGTAAYMAPEQAKGKTVDRRADIWAFGCVLFEILTGRRAFEGDAVTDTLAGILRGEPEWQALPAETPPAIRRLLRRCLEKDPRQRLQAIGDARIEIVEAAIGNRSERTVAAPVLAPRRRGRWVVPLAAVIATPLLIAATWKLKPAPAPDVRVTRSLIALEPFDERKPLADGQPRPRAPRPDRTALVLSPDGRTLVFRALVVDATPNAGTQSQLFVRSLDNLTAFPIATTTGSDTPFFSPDGAWIAYWDAGELRRVPVSGGNAAFTTIARVPEGSRLFGASWGDDDRIVFATAAGMWRVAAGGGEPESIAKLESDENARLVSDVLPGARSVLVTIQKTAFRWDDAQVVARSLTDGAEKVLLTDAADARYVASGHLAFMRRGRLMAVPFDRERLELTGSPVAVVDEVMQAVNMGNSVSDTGAGQFAVARQGTLAYATGGVQRSNPSELVWVDRATGTAQPVGAPQGPFGAPRLSPDGQRILMFSGATAGDDGNRLWVYDLARRTHTALSAKDERILWGVWSPDGRQVVYEKLDAGRGTLNVRRSDGTGTSQQIADAKPLFQTPASWSKTGRLAFVEAPPSTGPDIRVLDTTGADRAGVLAVQSNAADSYPEFSPDGKWLAYASDASGRLEVYVQPYPGPGSRVLISTGGGVGPTWRGDGGELYYYWTKDGETQMFAVPIQISGAALSAGPPREMFRGRFGMTGPGRGYDVTPDGKRFLFVRGVEIPPPPPSQLVLVENWSKELAK
jgi:serine/threonine-protein kinase